MTDIANRKIKPSSAAAKLWKEFQNRFVDSPRRQTPGPASRATSASRLPFLVDGKFRPSALAEAIKLQFAHLINVTGTFYCYTPQGLWKEVHTDELGKAGKVLLGTQARSAWIGDGVNLLRLDVQCHPEEFQPRAGFINVQNGMLEVNTRHLHTHAPEYKSRSQLPYTFDPNATSPRWDRFLVQVFEQDPDSARTLKQWFGYCLTHETFLQLFMIFAGGGANGKGTALRVLEAAVGQENFCVVAFDKMDRPFTLMQLKDKLVNLGGEVDTSRDIPASTLKALTGEDMISAEQKYKDPVQFRPTAKHVFTVNEMPRFRDPTEAIRRRTVILPFDRHFAESERDPHLTIALVNELPGILNWALEGLSEVLRTKRLHRSKAARRYDERFARAQNPVIAFIGDRCAFEVGATIHRPEIYRQYELWNDRQGGGRALTKPVFFERLLAECPQVRDVRIKGVDYFKGLRVR